IKLFTGIALISLFLGCNKDDVFSNKTGGMNKFKSSGGQNLTSLERDLSTYMEIPDYMPASIEAIRAERTELLMAVDNNTPYRNRTLSETMFLYEAAVNMDINHMPIPLKKFKKEISVFNISKAEDGSISAAGVKSGINSIVSKLAELGAAHRFVGSIDVEPIQYVGNDVRIRAVFNTGEPFDGFPDPDYYRPYGDENFLQLTSFAWGNGGCKNPIPEENAADDLSGMLYNGGNFGAWVQNNATQYYTFINNQWVFTGYDNWDPNKKLYYAIHVPGLYTSYLWTHVNTHTFHWSLSRSYADFWDGTKSNNGQVYIPGTWGGSGNLPFEITIAELHGRFTSFNISALTCSEHYNLNSSNSGAPHYNETSRIFYRPAGGRSPGAGKSPIENCFWACIFSDFADAYWDHVKDASLISKLPSHPKNNKIVGMEVLPSWFYEGQGTVGIGATGNPKFPYEKYGSYDVKSIEHFIFPSYGDKVEFGPYF
ncbi:MAG: hypothetical protein ACK43K_09665, partial [Chitinophagales bacterium]